MNENDLERAKNLLQQAIQPIGAETGPARDLWPAVLRRLDDRPAEPAGKWVWLDFALLAALVAFAAFVPASIPVFLYYL